MILGVRDVPRTQKFYDKLGFDTAKHTLTLLPLDLSDLKGTQTFVRLALERLNQDKIDYLLLNAAISDGSEKPGPHGSKWSEPFIVNHLAQHYLVHLLRGKLVESKSRIVFVSSGAVRQVEDAGVLDHNMKAGSGVPGITLYGQTKFTQLLGAHWWRRQLSGQCVVVAVSPGLIPGTGLSKGMGIDFPANMPDAKPVPEGELKWRLITKYYEGIRSLRCEQERPISSALLLETTSLRIRSRSFLPAGVSGGPRTSMGRRWIVRFRISGVLVKRRSRRRRVLAFRKRSVSCKPSNFMLLAESREAVLFHGLFPSGHRCKHNQ